MVYPAGQTDSTGTDSDAIHDNVDGEIAAVAEKASPVAGDLVLIEDSAASNAKKKAQVGNLPTPLHASDHTDGTDDIQDATDGQKGLATAAQITKLDAIEALADVTDATNVAAAGAGMLGTQQTWTKNQRSTVVALSITGAGPATCAITVGNSNQFTLTADEAFTLSNPSDVVYAGQEWTITVTQSGGAWALTLDTEYQADAAGIDTTTVTTGRRYFLHFHAVADGDIIVKADLGSTGSGWAA